jgi:16S rRNA processing protein RimM
MTKETSTGSAQVCIGAVVGAKGVRGEVRIKSFTADPRDVGAYGPVTTDDGRTFDIRVTGMAKETVVARLGGVDDRNAAEALKGAQLYVARSELPPPEQGSYYHADLIGMAARLVTETGDEALGKVSAVFNFGAGDMLEVAKDGGETVLVPFSDAAIAGVDIVAGVVRIVPLPGLFGDDETEVESAQ